MIRKQNTFKSVMVTWKRSIKIVQNNFDYPKINRMYKPFSLKTNIFKKKE